MGFSFSSVVAAQSFNLDPANPVLNGEPLTISLRGLPVDADVKISVARVVFAFGQAKPVLYRAEIGQL